MKNIRICTDEDLELTDITKAYLSKIGTKGGKAKSKKKTLACRANAKKPRPNRKKKKGPL